MTTTKTALVIGANGGIGSEAATALRRHGWRVRALVRKTTSHGAADKIEQLVGDAMNANDVIRAAQGVDVIVHAVNPPGYRDWHKSVLPMIDNSIAAAKTVGARIVLPGTIYNFGPDAFPVVSEISPQHPTTQKGLIRVELERRLADAAASGVRTLIMRCGDFFGPRTGNSWFSQGLIKPGKPLSSVPYPGPPEVGHAWAYLPDVGEAMARLLDRESDLETFAAFNFGGYWLDGYAMASSMARAIGQPTIELRRFPWWTVTLAAPFVQTLRELRKMRYLWQTPIRLDDSKLRSLLGDTLYTPIDDALSITLHALGCVAPTPEVSIRNA